MLAKLLQAVQPNRNLYVDDVFSAYTYTGNGDTQTIINGIDLAGEGGLVWIKSRDAAGNHGLFDTSRGAGATLYSNTADASDTNTARLSSFNSDGFSLGSSAFVNENARSYISWTFRKSAKFFDVVLFTAGSSTNRRIAHQLGQAPGLAFLKRTDSSVGGDWVVYHAALGRGQYLKLNTTDAAVTSADSWGTSDPTTTDFGIKETQFCVSGGSYVLYLFAHDTASDGIVQCGSFTTDGSGNATVTLGWEPQFLLLKGTAVSDWHMVDTARGWTVANGQDAYFKPNTDSAEGLATFTSPTATGFTIDAWLTNNTQVYLAIRRPNKPPTSGTQVYNAIARTGTGAAATIIGAGFPPDVVLTQSRDGTWDAEVNSRLRGVNKALLTTVANAETTSPVTSFDMGGITISSGATQNTSGTRYINHFLKRAPGFMDEVCYTGTGVARTLSHNLGVPPELIITKCRSWTYAWGVYHASLGPTKGLYLNTTDAEQTGITWWNSTTPTSSVFSLAAGQPTNVSGETYVAYLFATLPGISKVGSYTGTGTVQQVNCGFSAGARFVLAKRTDAAGDWYLWDSARGIVAGSDPYLLLNSTVAEDTSTDYIDPLASGFELPAASPLNTSGGSYIFLAIA